MTIGKKNRDALEFLNEIIGEPRTLGNVLESLRLSDEETQISYSKKLGISQAHLSQIEKGLKTVSAERARKFAKILGYSEVTFVQLAIQDELNRLGIKMKVHLEAG